MILDPRARRRLFASWLTRIGLVGCIVVMAVAVLGTLLAPYPTDLSVVLVGDAPTKLAPSSAHPMGTDWHGVDVCSRVLKGTRYSVGIGLAASAVAVTVGLFVGLTTGYFGGLYDAVWMRFVDVVLAFPELLLTILIAATFEPGLKTVFLALSLSSWAGIARLIRSLVLSARKQEYITAAIALGATDTRVILRHLLPNMLPTLAVIFATRIGVMILAEASLNFLGLGATPGAPSWGVMVYYGMDHLADAPWCAVAPATAIALTVFSFNLLGDGVRDALDPRLRQV